MSSNKHRGSPPKVLYTFLPVAIALVLALIIFWENSPIQGYLEEIFGVDLSSFFLPVMAIILSQAASRIVSRIGTTSSRVVGSIIKYIGYMLLISTIPFEQLQLEYLRIYVAPAVVLIAGLLLAKIGNVLGGFTGYLLKGIALLALYFSLYITSQFIEYGLFVAFFYAYISATLAYFLSLLKFSRREDLRELGEYFSRKIGSLAFVGFLAGLYVVLREHIYRAGLHPTLITLFEVTSLIIGLIIVFEGIYSHFRREGIERYIRERWVRHRAEIFPAMDKRFIELYRAVEDFIVGSRRENLLVQTVLILSKNNVPPHRISEIIKPLVYHRDEEAPILSFRWYKKMVERRNMDKRIKVVKNIIDMSRSVLEGGRGGGY